MTAMTMLSDPVHVPGLGSVDVRVGRAAGLPRVVQAPQTVERRIVRGGVRVVDVVGLDDLDPGITLEPVDGFLDAHVVQLDQPESDTAELLHLHGACFFERGFHHSGLQSGDELHQDFALDVGFLRWGRLGESG